MSTSLDKYLLGCKDLSLIEKKTGTLYMFRCPNSKIYLIDDFSFTEKMVGPSVPKNMAPSMLLCEDTFKIHNRDFRGLIQYKYKFHSEYCIMMSGGVIFIIRGEDF